MRIEAAKEEASRKKISAGNGDAKGRSEVEKDLFGSHGHFLVSFPFYLESI